MMKGLLAVCMYHWCAGAGGQARRRPFARCICCARRQAEHRRGNSLPPCRPTQCCATDCSQPLHEQRATLHSWRARRAPALHSTGTGWRQR